MISVLTNLYMSMQPCISGMKLTCIWSQCVLEFNLQKLKIFASIITKETGLFYAPLCSAGLVWGQCLPRSVRQHALAALWNG